MSQVSLSQVRKIYNDEFDLDFSEKKLVAEMLTCNQNAGHQGRDASGWCRFYASQYQAEQIAEGREAEDFHWYAYGDD